MNLNSFENAPGSRSNSEKNGAFVGSVGCNLQVERHKTNFALATKIPNVELWMRN